MIVNPQVFNYKIIIGSLIVAIAGLGIFGFSTYESTKAEQRFLEQEKKLVESELSQMMARYDELSQTSDHISFELDSAKRTARSALEKLRLTNSDLSVLKQFKTELAVIKSQNHSLFSTIDSIYSANDQLEENTSGVHEELIRQKSLNHALIRTNASLKKTIKKAAMLTAHSITATAYKSLDMQTVTTRAAATNRIDVCLTLAENALAQKGAKDIYIQILNPLNNVIGQKGSIEFGESLLIYSNKQVVHYTNKALNFCTSVHAQKTDLPFSKGTYYVSVFLRDRKLGETQFVLN